MFKILEMWENNDLLPAESFQNQISYINQPFDTSVEVFFFFKFRLCVVTLHTFDNRALSVIRSCHLHEKVLHRTSFCRNFLKYSYQLFLKMC